MPFPESERVRYRRNTLRQVICQLRFPTILRVDTEKPADFQERIRDRFPLYSEVRQLLSEAELPEAMARIVREQINLPTGPVIHQFGSADNRWSVALCSGFLAVTDRGYTRWEECRGQLEHSLASLEEIYRPAFYNRIGLRYQNVICRSELGLSGVDWSQLLAPHICGELSDPGIASAVEQAARQLVVDLRADGGKVQVQHGLITGEPTSGNPETCFGIDADFYTTQRREVSDARKILDEFNRRARFLFRWCIADRLHQAMEPEPL